MKALELDTAAPPFVFDGDQNERPAKPLRLRRVANVTGPNPLAWLSCQPKKASEVWTQAEFTNLCDHLHNGNGPTHYVMAFRDNSGVICHRRSKRVPVDRAISWSWASIARSPKRSLAFVPYANNQRQQSRWGGMDFDAHHGETDRARELAFAAFQCLLNQPNLCLILESSGSGGWHVWAISPDFQDTREWVRLLKSVAAQIGAPIADGVCEIFPPDSLPSQFGRGLRAPGCWNPRTDKCSEIVWENTRPLLEAVLTGNEKSNTAASHPKSLQRHFPDKRKKNLSLSPLYRESNFLQSFGITAPCTRNQKLAGLTGALFHQVGFAVARSLVEAQFRHKTVTTVATEQEHMASFEQLWEGLAAQWRAGLSKDERSEFTSLATDNESDAFRIIRSFATKAEKDGSSDFPIVRDNLAERLGITGIGAGGIRDKLCNLGILAKTANYIPNKAAARFKWLLK